MAVRESSPSSSHRRFLIRRSSENGFTLLRRNRTRLEVKDGTMLNDYSQGVCHLARLAGSIQSSGTQTGWIPLAALARPPSALAKERATFLLLMQHMGHVRCVTYASSTCAASSAHLARSAALSLRAEVTRSARAWASCSVSSGEILMAAKSSACISAMPSSSGSSSSSLAATSGDKSSRPSRVLLTPSRSWRRCHLFESVDKSRLRLTLWRCVLTVP